MFARCLYAFLAADSKRQSDLLVCLAFCGRGINLLQVSFIVVSRLRSEGNQDVVPSASAALPSLLGTPVLVHIGTKNWFGVPHLQFAASRESFAVCRIVRMD